MLLSGSLLGESPSTMLCEISQNFPSESEESRAMSRELKKRGFKFVGPTICYAFMQAVGLVNDHLVQCFRYDQIRRMTYEDTKTLQGTL